MGKLNIKVNIEGVDLPLTVNSTDEEKVYRDAASLIQDRLRKLRDLYSGLPEKTYYAMVMLYTAVDAVHASNTASTGPLMEVITDLEKELDNVLK
ncbi:MAG: cell division protein ZapA [Bacteroidaceae bacterium]|nr:cell division protein ZapA [Bacteroidaceae bacterium]